MNTQILTKIISLLLLICFIVSCTGSNIRKRNDIKPDNSRELIPEPDKDPVYKVSDEEIIFQKIIDLKDLQWIYHSEQQIIILQNNIKQAGYSLTKFNKNILFVTQEELNIGLKQNPKLYEQFLSIKTFQFIKNETKLIFNIFKVSEGVEVKGSYYKENGVWQLSEYKVIEFS